MLEAKGIEPHQAKKGLHRRMLSLELPLFAVVHCKVTTLFEVVISRTEIIAHIGML